MFDFTSVTPEYQYHHKEFRQAQSSTWSCRVLQRAPADLAALSNRGYAFRKLGQFGAASEDYTAALKQSPGTVRLHNNRGYCLAKLGKYKSAIQDYQAVIQLDPANAHAYHNRCALTLCCSFQELM